MFTACKRCIAEWLILAVLVLPNAEAATRVRRVPLYPAAGGVTYLLDENFDTTRGGACSGFQRSGWTCYNDASSLATLDEDSTVAPPVGSVTGFSGQALNLTDSTGYRDGGANWTASSSYDLVYIDLYVYVNDYTTNDGNSNTFLSIESSSAQLARLSMYQQSTSTNGYSKMRFYVNAPYASCYYPTGDANLAKAASYRIGIKLNNTTGAKGWEFRVNGSTVCSGTDDPAGQFHKLGLINSSDYNLSVFFDDVKIRTDDWVTR